MTQTAIDQLINHIALVLDCSTSMDKHSKKVVEVAKAVIADLAKKSNDFQQETRITIYSFADDIRCLVYDKDVLRLPDIADLYHIGGNTALMAATLKSIQDLRQQPEIYGDHAFWDTVITDGQENRSWQHKVTVDMLTRELRGLPDNWTMSTLVPDKRGIEDAVRFGFARENCGTWDTTSSKGFESVHSSYTTASDVFFTNRSKGIRRTTGVFSPDVKNLNDLSVSAALERLASSRFRIFDVSGKYRADDFCLAKIGQYNNGNVFYQLTKPEDVQPSKQICIRNRVTGEVFGGPNARRLLGLDALDTVRVVPAVSPQYDIFVQSTAPNRNLMPNTKVLVMV